VGEYVAESCTSPLCFTSTVCLGAVYTTVPSYLSLVYPSCSNFEGKDFCSEIAFFISANFVCCY